MKLKGELKEKIEKAESKEQAKEILDKTGIELTDEELDAVTGGYHQSNLEVKIQGVL